MVPSCRSFSILTTSGRIPRWIAFVGEIAEQLISGALAAEPYEYDIVHINAEFANRTSDHDPQVVRFPLFPITGLRP